MNFKLNSIKADFFPFSVWSKLMREVLLEQDTKLLLPAPYNGVAELREAIADHLYHFRGMSVDPGQIVVGAGTEYLYNLIIQLLGRDNVMGIENPGYYKISRIYDSNRVEYRYVDIDEHGMSVRKLEESRANIIHISPSHHYPTGIVTSIGRRHQLLDWANKSEDRYVIEDDYDSEFRFAGRPIQPLQSIDRNEKVLFINTFSKTMAPSIRISYMVLPPHLLKKYRENLGFYSCTVPSFEQYTLAKFITEGYFERHVNRTRKLYRAQRDKVIEAARTSAFGGRAEILGEDAGLHFLLHIQTKKSDAEIIKLAEGEDIGLSSL
jgi:GntR family transcriptional regulator/MocR family aminotransferase